MNIILHSNDLTLLSHWEKSIKEDFIIEDEMHNFKDIKDRLIVLNYSSLGLFFDEFIVNLEKNNNKLLVLDRLPTLNKAKSLLKLGIKGYGNALMKDHFIISAIETIKDGMVWLYPSFTTMLIEELPQTSNDKQTILEPLSPREKEVALFLKDGLKYNDVAEKLNITVRTVKAHAQKIYSKLNVKDKLSLALLLK